MSTIDDLAEEDAESNVQIPDMLQLQLSEYEMLKSMYPSESELRLDDPTAVANMQSFLDGKIEYQYLHSRIGFSLHITSDSCKVSVELVCQLPHEYPSTPPVVFTRAQNMTRENHSRLNDNLQEFISSLDSGELCLYSVIEWIKENLDNYESEAADDKVACKAHRLEEDTLFVRLWIYSHHIYSKFKRRDIIDWAQELKLTGFSLPGKPGVVCVEGYSRPVDEYWQRLRRLNWKRLMVKEREEKDIGTTIDINTVRKFGPFEEKVFDARAGKGREYHMDLGVLNAFLKDHDSGHIFPLYFGVEGKSSA